MRGGCVRSAAPRAPFPKFASALRTCDANFGNKGARGFLIMLALLFDLTLPYEPTTNAAGASNRQRQRALLVSAALHRGGNPHRFAVFRDRAAGNINA